MSAGEEALRQAYVIGDEIGRGRFGTVRRCYAASTGEAFAVKSTDKAPLREADPFDLALAEQEPKVHLLVSAAPPASRHVVALHAAFEDADAVHLVLDLCAGGDLFALLSARGPLPEPEAADLMAQLADGLAGCHRRGVAHRDVKPDNVFFDASGVLKLGDFGSAEWFGDGRPMTGLVGTPYYVAPEVVAGREYSEKVDVWSAGVVLYMMLSGTVPFYGATAGEIFESVLRGNLRFPPRAFASTSPEAKDLIRRMLCKDVSRRFSAEQVLRHPWIVTRGGSAAR
ncbi:phosphoenolpyruvate carboxylase kinase 2-like [Phragmites australis]|uniref:phosphoenolpyruvate carboxylase kinase 2-like n=1 Tax=Phragmites australis TaxID=29695 RepID=UPI002D7694C8|nr:phosphoenolpyruvate carboxylase kinase 2-like [Phragmites australis]